MAGLYRHLAFLLLTAVIGAIPTAAVAEYPRYIMYLTGQHPIIPALELIQDVTHVAVAFMRSEIFNNPDRDDWPLFMTVEEVRARFPRQTKIMVAIGGWGNENGFRQAARSEGARKIWADSVRRMVESTGADGVDVDWEYPGGNGEDYKKIPNSEREWEIDAYPQLLSAVREAIGPSKVISTAVPGLPRDMLAFTTRTIPSIMASVDFLNIMTYDLMNRRDHVTKHHTGIQNSLEAINAYTLAGVPPSKANLGLAFYVKWFKTNSNAREECMNRPIGCEAALMEDPATGADLGRAGAFSWHDQVPDDLVTSFSKAIEQGDYDEEGGGHYYFDAKEDLFWSWDTVEAIRKKFPRIVEAKSLGGVFAWGLGEDADIGGGSRGFQHLKAANEEIRRLKTARADRTEL